MAKKMLVLTLLLAHAFALAGVKDAANAKASDVAVAERFLSSLPAACSSSYAYASSDGTVHIRTICSGNGKAMDGLISIKDGLVTKVR